MRCSVLPLALAMLAAGCEASPQQPASRDVWVDPGWPYALVQADLYDLVARGTSDGVERWRYRREQPPPAPFGRFAVPTLVCRPEWTVSHNIVLRYPDGIHVLAAENGELLWVKELRFEGNCPVATPDSGMVLIVEHGVRLEKLDGEGKSVWHHDFWELGVAVAQPVVVLPAGDTLVRTGKYLLNVSPSGHRNWAVETAASPAPNP